MGNPNTPDTIEETKEGVIILDEEQDETKAIIEEWRQTANKMTMSELPAFLKHLTEDYEQDYGTICHAMSLGSIATMWAINRTDQGGITGFQAGAIMWENIINWMPEYKNKPIKLVDQSNMLYPQYEESFQKIISKDTMVYLQKEAQILMDKEGGHAGEQVKAHWQLIIDGEIPFGYVIGSD